MSNTKGCGLITMNLHSQPQRHSFVEEKICVYVRITAVLFIRNFKPQSNIQCNVHIKSSLHSSISETLCFSRKTQGYILWESSRKNIGFWLVYSIPSTMFIRSCTKWFPFFSFSIKCSEIEKKISPKCKHLWKTSSARNQLHFTRYESTSYLAN